MGYNEGDQLAAIAARQTSPPTGRVHLHLFVVQTSRVRVTDHEHKFVRWGRDFKVRWQVSRKASTVCKVPGRCVLADVAHD